MANTQDTAYNQIISSGNAPDFRGGYYGEQSVEGGGGWEPLSDKERALLGNRVPAQTAITNNYDIGADFRGGYYGEQIEPSGGGYDPTVDKRDVTPAGDPVTTTRQGDTVNISGGTQKNTDPDAAQFTGPIPNPLHDYPSYTYGLSLHMLTIEEYNQIVENQTYTPNRVIIASAGRYNNTPGANQFVRAPYFEDDFYFENLEMQTVIGLNDHSRSTNAVEIDFTVIEPYGVTLFNRILKLTKDINPKSENYLEQPYLLQIDFFATDDAGVIVGPVPDQTKKIPIRILKFDIKVSNKGSEYSIKAAPFNHSAYDLSTVSTPAHFEIVAGTVASFFQSTEAEIDAIKANIKNQRELKSTLGLRRNTGLEGGVIGPDGQITYVATSLLSAETQSALAATASGDPVYRVKSYGSAINAWQNELERQNKVEYVDTYYFKFHPDIGEAKFDVLGKYAAKNTPMTGVEQANEARRSNIDNTEVLSVDYNTQIFSINAGTSLEMVLNYVIRNSSYVQDQLVIPEDAGANPAAYKEKKKANADKPLRWFKIIPTIKLDPSKFDRVRKVWAREITYHVVPYEVYNTKIAVAPQGTWNDPLKVYNYIYTGKNVDVIDFEIAFNALYYTATTAYRDNLAGITGLPVEEEEKTSNVTDYEGIEDDPNAIMPVREKPQTLDARARATGGNDSAKSVAAVDVAESLYTTSGGDMLQAKLRIIGDPMYIKQDDIFYTPTIKASTDNTIPTADPRLIANGSLHMDDREVYIQVNYRTPTDVDESTGMMKFENNFNQSSFSGMYRVLTVSSSFSQGRFIQTLNTVRLPRQKSLNDIGKIKSTTNQRNVDSTQVTYSVPEAGVDYPTSLVSGSTAIADSKAPGSRPVLDLVEDTVLTEEQRELSIVRQTAQEQNVNLQNEPQAIAPDFRVNR